MRVCAGGGADGGVEGFGVGGGFLLDAREGEDFVALGFGHFGGGGMGLEGLSGCSAAWRSGGKMYDGQRGDLTALIREVK